MNDHDATMVADVGQNQMWTARYAGFRRPHSHLSSGGLGTMGYAMPAAMGAALGRPDKKTWAHRRRRRLPDDAPGARRPWSRTDIPVKIALLDNHKLGMIRQWQELVYANNYHSSDMVGPDYLKLADAYGIPALRATTPGGGRRGHARRQRRGRPGARLVRDRRASRTSSR